MSTAASATDLQPVRFILDGELVSVSGLPPSTTVLEYLRDHAGRTGTKEGCAEGDCGACTVVLGELSADERSVDYRAINSCIRFLATITARNWSPWKASRLPTAGCIRCSARWSIVTVRNAAFAPRAS